MGGDAYSRTISSEEAREGYILVLKYRLPFFPPLGRRFDLAEGHSHRKTRVESYRCTCRGPELPHEHYFIRWKGLKPKVTVEIKRDSEHKSRYTIRMRN